jgi:hypothetical protein
MIQPAISVARSGDPNLSHSLLAIDLTRYEGAQNYTSPLISFQDCRGLPAICLARP